MALVSPGSSLLLGGFHTQLGLGLSSLSCLREMRPVWEQSWAEDRGLGFGGPSNSVPLTIVWMLRYLEEGNIQAAEAQKRRIEQLQRDRRRVMEENNIIHQARFFRCLCPRPGSLPSRLPSSSPLVPSCFEWGQQWEAASRDPSLNSLSSPRRQTDSSGKEWWVTNNTYWRLRAEPGYGNLDGAVLW